jgi:hypothetical protein
MQRPQGVLSLFIFGNLLVVLLVLFLELLPFSSCSSIYAEAVPIIIEEQVQDTTAPTYVTSSVTVDAQDGGVTLSTSTIEETDLNRLQQQQQQEESITASSRAKSNQDQEENIMMVKGNFKCEYILLFYSITLNSKEWNKCIILNLYFSQCFNKITS